MSALVNLQYALVAHLWANVAAQPRDLGETGQHVELRQRRGDFLNLPQRLEHLLAHALEQFVLELLAALLRAENFALHLLEFRRDESLRISQGLLACVVLRHFVEVRFGYFDEIAKHRIEPHLERGDAGFFRLPFLELCYPILALRRAATELVKRRVEAFANDAAVLERHRRVIDDRPGNQVGHLGQVVQFAAQLA